MGVAIIGGAGFIGSSLAGLLAREGLETVLFDTEDKLQKHALLLQHFQTRPFPYPEVINLHQYLDGYDVLVHLACTTEPASSMESMLYDAGTNIIPSLKIFQAAVEAGVQRIIFASSGGTVYGNAGTIPASEDDEKNPVCAYGVSKLSVEHYLNLYANSNRVRGISLRIGNPYGFFQFEGTTIGIVAHFLDAIHKGEELQVWGDGSVVRDYIDIDCVARAFLAAITSPSLPSGPYNIGTGTGVSINELIELIFKVTGRKVPVKYNPGRPFDVSRISLDSSRFTSLTAWHPETALKDGIQKMWDYMNYSQL
jgi:UDP-glucose 4-epimerase